MNKIINYILFLIGIIIGAFWYVLASYYFRYGKSNNIKFIYIYIISILFAIISFSIKIPIFYYLGNNITIMTINILFLILSFILVVLFSKYILKEIIPIYTYIIILLIVLLISLNLILDLIL